MKRFYTIIFLLLFAVICFAQNFEGFETGNFISYNWQFLGQADWGITISNTYEGAFCAQSGQISDDGFSMIQVSMETITTGDISFYWSVDSEAESDLLKFYVDNVEISSISGNMNWQLFSESIDPGIHTFAWSYQKDSFGVAGMDRGWLDNITFPETTTFPNDLAALSVVGPSTLYQGHSGVYSVHVKNYGSNAQDSYTLRLYREGGIVLDELLVNETLPSEAAIIHYLVWIVPPDEPYDETYVYAEVILPGDEDPSNNITPDFDVIIFEIGLAQIRVGYDTDKTNWYPFKFHMRASLAETIYFSSEIQYIGNIHAIGYQNDFVSYITNAQIQIWMGGTNQSSLVGGWIGAGSLTSVYDGTFTFPMGNNSIIIPLDDVFTYNGGNICVLTHRVYDSNTYHQDDEFMETEETIFYDRTRAVGSANPLDPYSPPPPTSSFVFSRYPNTTFYMEITELGNVEGYVYDELGNNISTANIVLEEYNMPTVSNGSGFYQFGNIMEGNYSFTASKPGYISDTQPGIVITDETTIIDFYLETIPTIQIIGHLVASDDPNAGLSNAVIDLYGNENYQVLSDENGDFIFPEVYANDNYILEIQKFGYENYTQSIDVGMVDIDMGTIVIDETAFPPDNLIGVQNMANTEISLTWIAPFELSRDFETYKIYRFLEALNGVPSGWVLLEENYTDTSYVDTYWANLLPEQYQYCVIACYAAGIESLPAYSNVLVRTATGNENELVVPAESGIQSVYPNPFNPETIISYYLAAAAEVEINIYNVKGQKVKQLISDQRPEGQHSVTWNGTDQNNKIQSSGIYFIRLYENGKNIANRKCILMK